MKELPHLRWEICLTPLELPVFTIYWFSYYARTAALLPIRRTLHSIIGCSWSCAFSMRDDNHDRFPTYANRRRRLLIGWRRNDAASILR
jgi:hypothetical protein